ncbi:hypothetical protein ACOI1A_00835 [Corynebacterium glutamicum]|uniref:hypothetical protein n=1 Tax=Corynebacterium glutamicum TaxID=1718 RepID=UPI003B5AEAD4
MAWFKVDDGFWSHPKVLLLSDSAVALWVKAGTYSCQHLTDGEIPRQLLRFLGTESAADELVESGLWNATDQGFRFHDWDDYQETSDAVKQRRDQARERQRKRRAERDKPKNGHASVTRDSQRDTTVSHSEVSTPDPTRPDPTRPTNKESASAREEDDEKPKARSKPRTRIPADWSPTDTHIAYANERRLDLDREATAFRAHAEANDRLLVNWNSGFTQWLTKARPQTTSTAPARRPGTEPSDWRRSRPQPAQDFAQGYDVIDAPPF